MRVLVACEYSGVVRQAFRSRGHDAWSCDLIPALDGSPYHVQGDALDLLGHGWDMMIAHPPCTYLAYSGMHWTWRGKRSAARTVEAAWFAALLLHTNIPRVCVENPRGVLAEYLGPSQQVLQPYQFGDSLSKQTHLWLRGLPPLITTARAVGRFHGNGMPERFPNQTPSGNDRTGQSAGRGRKRSLFPPGVAAAMAQQWG